MQLTMMATKPSDAADNNVSNNSNNNSKQPKSYKWLHPRRWKLHGGRNHPHNNNKSGLSPAQDLSLQQDLDELAGFATAVASSTTSHDVAVWSLDALQSLTAAGEQPWRSGGSAKAGASQDLAQIVLVHHQASQYALKRLPTETATASAAAASSSKRETKKTLATHKRLATAALVKEATLLAKMGNHPNILALRGLPTADALADCVTNDAFFFLTDPLHRETLDRRIRSWRHAAAAPVVSEQPPTGTSLPPTSSLSSSPYFWHTHMPDEGMIPRKSSYAYQIAKALQACHQAGILVRDLSPHKIGFLRDDPHVCQLFDLGHAVATTTTTAASSRTSTLGGSPQLKAVPTTATTIVGKRRYMAGEIWRTGQYSMASDVYSWAMIYYEMLAETKPYQGLSALDHQKFVCCPPHEDPERPPLHEYCLPDEMEAVLEKAWHPSPTCRPTTDQLCQEMQSLVLHLDACLLFYDDEERQQIDPNDFLLDVHVVTPTRTADGQDDDDAVSALGDTGHADGDFDGYDEEDELWSLQQTPSFAVEDPPAAAVVPGAADDDCLAFADGKEQAHQTSTSSTTADSSSQDVLSKTSTPTSNVQDPATTTTTTKIPSRTSSYTNTLSSAPQKKPCKIAPSAA